ncbi:Inner membrane protein YbhN [compost metagenome]
MLLGGLLFSSGVPHLPASWHTGHLGLRLIGVLLLAMCMGYLLACRFAQRRQWGWKGYRFTLPSLKVALLQAGLGMSNWAMMALLLYVLLPDRAQYHEVLAVLLVSAIAGVIAHIPAGLGVLEAVFIALLHTEIGQGSLLAALIGYRVLYFLIPLLLACMVYLWLERRARRLQKSRRNKAAKQG